MLLLSLAVPPLRSRGAERGVPVVAPGRRGYQTVSARITTESDVVRINFSPYRWTVSVGIVTNGRAGAMFVLDCASTRAPASDAAAAPTVTLDASPSALSALFHIDTTPFSHSGTPIKPSPEIGAEHCRTRPTYCSRQECQARCKVVPDASASGSKR